MFKFSRSNPALDDDVYYFHESAHAQSIQESFASELYRGSRVMGHKAIVMEFFGLLRACDEWPKRRRRTSTITKRDEITSLHSITAIGRHMRIYARPATKRKKAGQRAARTLSAVLPSC